MSRVAGRTISRAWALVRRHGVDLFAPDALERLPSVPGWPSLRLPGSTKLVEVQVSLLEALRALAHHQQESDVQQQGTVSLVGTLPIPLGGIEDTWASVRALVVQARREILLVGFTIRERDLVELIMSRSARGVQVVVVGDRDSGDIEELRRTWPALGPRPRLLVNVDPARGQPRRMHAKALVVDRARGLVGSANFTYSGMASNVELGVVVEGRVAQEVVRVVEELRTRGWLTSV